MPPTRCGITCYHVIVDDNADVRKLTDKPGIDGRKQNGTSQISIISPAICESKATIRCLERVIKFSNLPLAEDIQQLEDFRKEIAKPVIGHVFLASGLRLHKNRRKMDWALISTPGPYIRNKPAPAPAFHAQRDRPWDRRYTKTRDSVIRNCGRMRAEDWVAKQGRTSGYTSGQVNKLHREVKWEDHGNLQTSEVEVSGLSRAFAETGDLGSMVTNAEGELVGLLIGKDSHAHDFDSGLVTPIEEIQLDIEKRHGGCLSLE